MRTRSSDGMTTAAEKTPLSNTSPTTPKSTSDPVPVIKAEEATAPRNTENDGVKEADEATEIDRDVIENDEALDEKHEEIKMEEVGDGEDEEVAEEEQIEISNMVKRRMTKKEQEIFVGGLDRNATEEDLKNVFSKAGEVVQVRLHKDFMTNKNKGFAFVKFSSKEQVARALAEMKNPLIRGKQCGIAASEDNDTLFLGNICNTWTKEAIKRKLRDYGIDGLENITLVEDTQNEGLSRGFAFLEFTCHADAVLAYKRLQKPDVIFGHPERTAKVAFAEPLREPDAEVMAQVKSVFIDGLPPYWDEDRVKKQFKGYGEIERVVLARNMASAKRKDFGFVNFKTHGEAVACVEGVNNTELGDGKSQMKARARLANPLPKTQAVKGGMRGGFRIGFSTGGYSRFGRGFGRGRFSSMRAGFQGGRGFIQHGRGRGGRFPLAADTMERSYPDFRGRRSFGFRGGRRGSFRGAFSGPFDEFGPEERGFSYRRPHFPVDGDFGEPFGPRFFNDDPYFYGEGGPGFKRPYSMMEHDPGFLEPRSRLRTHFDYSDPVSGGAPYRGSLGDPSSYPHDYVWSDDDGSYSSLYGERYGSRYYY